MTTTPSSKVTLHLPLEDLRLLCSVCRLAENEYHQHALATGKSTSELKARRTQKLAEFLEHILEECTP